MPRFARALDALRATPIVTMAAIDGFALGAGVQFAAACDLRVATTAARFGVPAAKLGLAVDHTTVQHVVGMLGGAQARAMLLACEEVSGQRAYDLGFVNRLGSLGDAMEWAENIASLAPLDHRRAQAGREPARARARRRRGRRGGRTRVDQRRPARRAGAFAGETHAATSRASSVADPSIPAAFGAGVLSFVSPCVLPLVPGYLSLMSGMTGAELADARGVNQRRLLLATLMFVAGFTVVFVALGASASAVGDLLAAHKVVLNQVMGAVVIVMGLFLAGVASPRLLQAEKRFHVAPSKLGPYAAPVMGIAFAFGWTPCIGPVLGGVLTLAAGEDTVAKGAALLFIYSLGLGVPFVVTGLGFGAASRPSNGSSVTTGRSTSSAAAYS